MMLYLEEVLARCPSQETVVPDMCRVRSGSESTLASPRSVSTADNSTPRGSFACESLPGDGIDSVFDAVPSCMPASVEVKNTFIHVGEQRRLLESLYATAPAGFQQEFLRALAFTPKAAQVSSSLSWADEMEAEEETALQHQKIADVAVALEGAEKIILEHLRMATGGSMSLSTIGNRIPKQYAVVFKTQGIRISDVVEGLPGVEVNDGVARLPGVTGAVEIVPSYCRGAFLKKIKRGDVTDDEAVQIFDVLQSVFNLVQASEAKQQSTFALGNWLAPCCRAFLKGYSLRLLELLKEFPMIFNCRSSGTAAKPVVRLVPESFVTLDIVKARLASKRR
mmetsp:Transcript_9478/g.20885  ORF Transcript_9478/g.20885 Transcript_9478/m.20885 type:complete len:337 (-) Transcript_9478:879-1889(-)|eukprot:CAMPEP_0204305706 /NCGR_PEP_ID=MMETSP0468-20130131/85060_1 /ASSEMBLY_ACC=CAM_ASM_000383 /TAXON_ID=2969 /ORGANISM="Oxyrrhis marina" /LENGTH=336 /DNA_ID=CAMNT_0051285057 /DNA_START=37 /DNA_END=1047 /DNA_ORIENTATION=+